MSVKKILLLSLFTFSCPVNCLFSESTPLNLSLKDVFSRIAQENPKVLLSRESVDQALFNAYIVRSQLLPNVSFQSSQSRSKLFSPFGAVTFTGYTNTFDAKLVGSVPLLDLRKLADFSIARMGHKISELDYKAIVDDIQAQAAKAYFEHMRNIKQLAVLDENIDRAEFLLQMADARYKAGIASSIDVARAEVALEREKKTKLQQETVITQSDLGLKKLLDIPLDCYLSLNLCESTALPQPTEHPCCPEQAFRNRSDFQSALEALRKNQFEEKSVVWEHLPRIDADGYYGLGSLEAFDGKEKNTWKASLHLSIPVFDGLRIRSKKLQAKSVVRSQKLIIKDLENEIHSSILLNQQDLQSRFKQISISEKQVELGRKELNLAQERFKNGIADNQEIVDAQANLAQAQFELVESIYAYNLAQVDWARSLGDLSLLLCYDF